MPPFPLTYTRDTATCPTFLGRTAEAVDGAADGISVGGRDGAHSSLFTLHSSLLTPPIL